MFALKLAFVVRHAHAVQARIRHRQYTDNIGVQNTGKPITTHGIVQWDRGVASWLRRLKVGPCAGGGRWGLYTD